ncbi:hypothetical protein J7K93_00140 [bacterium]|nr:hypothetical protein [bacterium]
MKFKDYKKPVLSILLIICFLLPSKGIGSDLDSTIDKIVRKMVQSVQQSSLNSDTVTAAIFPFQCTESLSRKKVNLAMSELLTQKLLKESFFKLVERNQLEIVLSEQKLGMTGAIESETAAKVGKIIGAQLVALGSVIQIGKSYQISVKLVETSTSEIIGAVIAEVPVKIFDQEASRYLILVPKKQAIGFYLEGVLFTEIKVDNQPAQTQWDVTVTPTNVQPKNSNTVGFGIRYFPFRNWMLDLYVMSLDLGGGDKPFEGSFKGSPVYPDELESDLNGTGFRFTLNKSFQIVDHLNAFMGLGVEYIFIKHKDKGQDSGKVNDNNFVYLLGTKKEKNQYFTPLFRSGVEWMIQSRFGLSCFVYGKWSDQTDTIYAKLIRQEGYEPYQRETVYLKAYKIHLPRFGLGISAALYF